MIKMDSEDWWYYSYIKALPDERYGEWLSEASGEDLERLQELFDIERAAIIRRIMKTSLTENGVSV